MFDRLLNLRPLLSLNNRRRLLRFCRWLLLPVGIRLAPLVQRMSELDMTRGRINVLLL